MKYWCVEGYSPNFDTSENGNIGSGVGQILASHTEQSDEYDEVECRDFCESYDAVAYNWEDHTGATGSRGCRCYAEASLTFTPTGNDWQFCTQCTVKNLKNFLMTN